MLGTGQDGGECCGKAIGEVNPSTLGKTTSLKQTVVVLLLLTIFDLHLTLIYFVLFF